MRINRMAIAALPLSAALLIAGCGPSGAGRDMPDPPEGAPPMIEGMVAYERACADCHESGKDGAPVTGDADAWRGRSSLWQAVLFEHAKAGYFDMPAKGNAGELSDEVVEAAAEYMLSLTHPDRPPDQD
jgi:cytochrome c5